MRLSLIAARAENDVIGRDTGIPWHLPADLAHFKALTTGHTVVMGRKTYESIGRPLPNRHIVVLTRDPEFQADGVTIERRDAAGLFANEGALTALARDEEMFVAGGAEIYRVALPHAQRMYLTRVHTSADGDVRFPAFDQAEWKRSSCKRHEADEKNAVAYSFEVWERG